jgi:membrane-associated PAP2 superfamily phosphatase
VRLRVELVLPLLLAVPLLVLLEHYGWDVAISRQFFDAAAGHFPLSENWWLKQVLHDDAKHLAFAFLCAVFIAAAMAHVYRPAFPYRRMLWQLFAAILFSAQAIAYLKHQSYQACPYQLQLFGGGRPYLGIFDAIPAGYSAGHCWPGGHGATAFSLFGLYFAARDAGRTRLALGLLAFVLLFGLALSVTQVVRGMHFVSHQIWTALICWYLTWLLYEAVNLWRRAAPAPSAHARV